jgi:hypothetical protein
MMMVASWGQRVDVPRGESHFQGRTALPWQPFEGGTCGGWKRREPLPRAYGFAVAAVWGWNVGRMEEPEKLNAVRSLRCKCMRFYLEPKSLIGMHFEHGVFICPYDL